MDENNCKDCLQATLVEKLDKRVASLEIKVGTLETTTALTADQSKRMFEMLTKIDAKLDSLEGKPGQRWEQAIRTIITVAISAAITWFISRH